MKFISGQYLKKVLESENPKLFLYVMSDSEKHSLRNSLSCAYIKTLDEEYFTSFSHPDYPLQSYDNLILNNVFVFNIKSLMNIGVSINNCFDLKYFLEENGVNKLLTFFKIKLNNINNLNSIVPFYVHMEHFKELSSILDLKDLVETKLKYDKKYLTFYHSLIPTVFSSIERQGVRINEIDFVNVFGPGKECLIENGMVCTNYNYYTSTGRPSNAWGGINYAALNKEDGSKRCFTSRHLDGNGRLVNIDFDSYHVYLIADRIGIEFDGNPHDILGKQYFGVSELTDEQYEQSKKITFKNLYGYEQEDIVKNILFFKEVKEFEQKLWEEYKLFGYINTDYRKLYLQDATSNKLFNYYIQAIETETNVKQMYFLIKNGLIPILYTYDSMVFDIKLNEMGNFLITLKKTLLFPYTMKIGNSLDDMEKV